MSEEKGEAREPRMANMVSGYAFECEAPWWSVCPDESWDIVVYSPNGSERYLGMREIDGAMCRVFKCADGKVRAQTNVATGGA